MSPAVEAQRLNWWTVRGVPRQGCDCRINHPLDDFYSLTHPSFSRGGFDNLEMQLKWPSRLDLVVLNYWTGI